MRSRIVSKSRPKGESRRKWIYQHVPHEDVEEIREMISKQFEYVMESFPGRHCVIYASPDAIDIIKDIVDANNENETEFENEDDQEELH